MFGRNRFAHIVAGALLPFPLFVLLPLLGQESSSDPVATVSEGRASISGRVGEWFFTPDYALPGPDRRVSSQYRQTETLPTLNFEALPAERLFLGHRPTDRRRRLLDRSMLPAGRFSAEFWISYHVNEPVGAMMAAYDPSTQDQPHWWFGFYQGEVYLQKGGLVNIVPVMEIKSGKIDYLADSSEYQKGLKRYWHHLVAVFDAEEIRLFHNGELRSTASIPEGNLAYSEETQFEIAAYLDAEPHMELANLVKYAAVYDRPLDAEEVASAYSDHRDLVEAGVHFRDKLHFTTGAPHIAMPGLDHIYLVWEADRPTEAIISWGEADVTEHQLKLAENGKRDRKVRIDGLQPNRSYFYRVVLKSQDGQTLDSEVLRFRTAVRSGDPMTFAAISDTEARPHVNARLADLMWSETPHLVINVGDLTDGGRHDNRVEWTHEYFAAMGHLMARTPFLPVMGNGEDDFVWFDRYHHTSAPEISYYNYRYGDVEFFVLDSNLEKRDVDRPGFRGRQRRWLRKVLSDSTAVWKIVAHHHPVLAERYPNLVSDFVGLYEEFGVDLVLVGHHHNYLRSWPLRGDEPVTRAEGGITYIQLGGGGGNRSFRPTTPDLRWEKTFQGYGYSMFWILGTQLRYAMYDDRGAMRDYFTIAK